MKAHGRAEVWLHTFVTFTVDSEVNDQYRASNALPPWNYRVSVNTEVVTECPGGCMLSLR